MKKFLLTAIMAVSTLAASAQANTGNLVVRPMIGTTLSSFMQSQSYENPYLFPEMKSKLKVGFAIGAEMGYQVNSWLQPSIGLFYNQQGSKIKQYYGDLTETENINMDYLTIPLLANFYVTEGLALKIGVQPCVLLSSKQKSIDYKDISNSTQIQIPVGISYEYKKFVFDACAFIPCTNAFKDDNSDLQNNAFQLTFGYNFEL